MQTNAIKNILAKNYKNLLLDSGLQINNLNIFIGPNGSGKSNLLRIFRLLQDSLSEPIDKNSCISRFENAVFKIGGSRILNGSIKLPAIVQFEYEFAQMQDDNGLKLELDLLVQYSNQQTIVKREVLGSTFVDPIKGEPFYYYKVHDRKSGTGAVSIYTDRKSGSGAVSDTDRPTILSTGTNCAFRRRSGKIEK